MQTRPLPYVGIRNRGVYSWDGRNGALRWDSDGFGKSFIDVPGRIPLPRDEPEPAILPPRDINPTFSTGGVTDLKSEQKRASSSKGLNYIGLR